MTDPFTLQEAFDTAYLGVVRQGRPSQNEAQSCFYRGPGGLKCAIGFLIDDETAKKYEGASSEHVARCLGWSQGLSRLAGFLQFAHDTAPSDGDFLRSFKKEAAQVAARFGLTVPPDPRPVGEQR